MDEDLNIRPKIIRLLKKNIRENIHGTGFYKDFKNITLKAQEEKSKRKGR